jgi:Mg-chelatase subunit ChlI
MSKPSRSSALPAASKQTSFRQHPVGATDDRAVGAKPIRSAIESTARIESAHLALKPGDLLAPYIGRI